MPIAEFPGSRNWGYDGVYPYAPSSRYGRPEALSLVAAVPRLAHQLYRGGETADWGEAEIVLPLGGTWRDVFAGRWLDRQDRVAAAVLFADFPVSVLIGGT
jgi:maltooligosyltrehalose synthase